MAKVYAVEPGARIRVDRFGEATVDEPVEVPEDVARELAQAADVFRVELELSADAAPVAALEVDGLPAELVDAAELEVDRLQKVAAAKRRRV